MRASTAERTGIGMRLLSVFGKELDQIEIVARRPGTAL
jgi:hypothetical protein